MLTRREYLKYTAMAGAVCTLPGSLAQALEAGDIIKRAIPSTGEEIPVVGLGSSATFRTVAQSEDVSALSSVLQTLVENGGTVFDTAPGYGASEEVAGRLVQELELKDDIFWATKVNVAPRGGGRADADAARAQLDRSFEFVGKDPIDLVQVHNLGDLQTQIPIIKELKEEGRIRYIGTTSTSIRRYPDLMQAMRDYELDFIGVDYAVDNRVSAEEVLPMAQDMGIAVLGYVPFGRTRLWARVRDREVPEWGQEFGADTWGKFFIKFVISHPAITCVTPATSKATNMLDNIGAAFGDLPDEATRQRMAEYVDALPSA